MEGEVNMVQTNINGSTAVIYARYSSHAQNEQSIEGQLKVCYDYAKQHGYNVIEEYIDRALSGKTDNRPDFQRMIADSAKRQFQYVIIYQFDRFARNKNDSAINKVILKKNGVRVLSARENISDDASGVLMESVLEGLAEYYSLELAQKIKRGMDLTAEKFLSTGSNPGLGYKTEPIDPTDNKSKKRIIIDEVNAAVVREIFEEYASGLTVAEICEHLNQRQVKTSSGSKFNKNSLRKMLQNKRYIGYYLYKGTETPNAMPRIITDDLFYRVQEIMNKNKKAPARARAKEEYILTTKLYCGYCKEMMTGISGTSKTGAIHNYYTCNGRKKKLCNKQNVEKGYIEDVVVDIARSQLTDENIAIIAAEVSSICEKELEGSNTKRLKSLLRENDKAINNLLNAIEQGQAVDIISQRLEQKQRERAEIEKEVAKDSLNKIQLIEPEIRFFLTEIKKGDINDINNRRMLITVLINRIYLYDDKITVIINAAKHPLEISHSLINDIELCNIDKETEFVYEGSCSTTQHLANTKFVRCCLFKLNCSNPTVKVISISYSRLIETAMI